MNYKHGMKHTNCRVTKAERQWIAAIQDLGCIVCIVKLGIWGTPPDIHHRLSGGRRMGHLHTLPICPPHHRYGFAKGIVSRDQCQRSFEAEYGTEEELYEMTKRLVSTREELRQQNGRAA